MNKHTAVFLRKSSKKLHHSFDRLKVKWNAIPRPERGMLRTSVEHVIEAGFNAVPAHEKNRVIAFLK